MGTIAAEQLSLLAGLRLKSQPSRLASIERRFPVAVALRIDSFVIGNHSEKHRPAVWARSLCTTISQRASATEAIPDPDSWQARLAVDCALRDADPW